MSKRISYIITDNNITVNFGGQTHIVPRKDALASRLIEAIRTKNLDEIPRLVTVAKRVEEFGQGSFKIEGEHIMVNGVAAPPVLSRKIIQFLNQGLPHEPLVKFAENLLRNPSFRSVNELYQFLEKNDHPITDNGCFIAYKKVRDNFKDVHSGTYDNSPGATVEMPRNQVNEDSTQTCSNGLHVANWDYASKFYSGGVMLEVEVNPADVVSIPVDYDQAKMRTCRYVVLGVVDREHSSEDALRTTVTQVPDGVQTNRCEDDDCHCRPHDDSDDEDDLEEEVELCTECGEELSEYEDDICDDCQYEEEEEEEEDTCTECGTYLTDEELRSGALRCEECDAEEEDRYPWEDELED